jgi:hypothetical protein
MGVYDSYFNAVYWIKKPKSNKSIHIPIHFVQFATIKGSHSNIFPIFGKINFAHGGGKYVTLFDT